MNTPTTFAVFVCLPIALTYRCSQLSAHCRRLQTWSRGWSMKIEAGDIVSIHGIKVRSVDVPHDAREPTQFVFESPTERFGLLTDIGSINDVVVEHYSGCNSLFVESNHDLDMLWNGNDPEFLKRRVSGDRGPSVQSSSEGISDSRQTFPSGQHRHRTCESAQQQRRSLGARIRTAESRTCLDVCDPRDRYPLALRQAVGNRDC